MPSLICFLDAGRRFVKALPRALVLGEPKLGLLIRQRSECPA